MDNLVSIQQVAKKLGLSVSDIKKLVNQEILHPKKQTEEGYFFLEEDVAQIQSNKIPTLSEEAAQVDIQIEQEVVTSISSIQELRRKVKLLSLGILSLLLLLIIVLAYLFKAYPRKTSDFFGYYYRFNAPDESQESVLGESTGLGRILQAAVGPTEAPIKTSVIADVLKPVAATSLVVVKAIDSQTYAQIVTVPTLLSEGIQGLTGDPGPAGAQGPAGDPGPAGAQGVQGPAGLSGEDGEDGDEGTSVEDVMSLAGDLIIRDIDNKTNRLPAGLADQILLISGGVPTWGNLGSPLTITSGAGLTGGGIASFGGSLVLDIGAGSGITVDANDISLNLTTTGTSGSTSSNSGLEVLSSGLTLLKGCGDNEVLKWTNAGGWACASDVTGLDLLHAASYDTEEAMTSITSTQTILGTVSVTPTTETADVYVTGLAEVISSNSIDQPFTLVIETTSDCTGLTVGNATVTYLITSGNAINVRGVLKVSGVALNPGASEQSYSLCASTSAGSSSVQSWSVEALVID